MSWRERPRLLLCWTLLCVFWLHGAAEADPASSSLRSSILEIASLEDFRFAPEIERKGRRDPMEFEREVGGLYIIGPYSRDRLPVVFIHGINASPRSFRYLIENLDRDTFQPFAFYYASGGALGDATQQLARALAELASRYDVQSIAIVAHSMGGLIARQWLVNEQPSKIAVPILITLSTPWDGHAGAAVGARMMPGRRAWHDIASGSTYLADLFQAYSGAAKRMPERTQHHLMFSYRRSWMSPGRSGDQVVSVASQLRYPAQAEASRLYGFDVSHIGILENPEVAALLQELLKSSLDFKALERTPSLQLSKVGLENRDHPSSPEASRP
jgi:pimeloyl-ACP methyl ester carboxylesterase